MITLSRLPRIGAHAAAVATLALLPLAGCKSATDATGPASTTVASVALTPSVLAIQVGAMGTLTAQALSATGATIDGKTVTWSSANPAIATVSFGIVTGVAPGTTLVTATIDGKSARVSVTVSAVPSGQAVFAQIAAGGGHTCALTAAGKAYCWGYNLHGELGDGTQTPEQHPVAVAGNFTFIRISAGGNHTCALIASGAAYCWGYNFSGELGDGTTANRLTPTLVRGGPFFEISAGGFHTCAIDAAGVASCWGAAPAIGDGVDSTRIVPTRVAGGFRFVYVGAGSAHNCGLTSDGIAYCWGNNTNGILGVDSTRGPLLVPTAVAHNIPFRSLATTYSGACGLTRNDATLYCWGFAMPPGRLSVTVPTLVPGGVAFFATLGIGPTGNHACAITSAHAAWCWGQDGFGQVGDGGPTGERAQPVAVAGGLSFAVVMPGGTHTCGLTTTGAAYCWGDNGSGQLGAGNIPPTHAPVAVLAP